MLLPALSRAKAKAQSVQCLNNLKQIGLAHFMYVNDSGRLIPYAMGVDLWMRELIQYYASVDAVRICPTAIHHHSVQQSIPLIVLILRNHILKLMPMWYLVE